MILNYLRLVTLIILFIYYQNSHAQVIADGLPGCLAIEDSAGTSCGGGTTFFGINGLGQFEVNNIDGEFCCSGSGGDGSGYFEFEEIDISCFQDIMISMNYSASSTNFEDDYPSAPQFGCTGTGTDNSHDQIVFMYIIDGGVEVQSLYVHGTTQGNFTGTWNEGPLNGNTLTIKVYAANKASAEKFYFDNLVIEAGASSVSAGDDFTYCGDGPINLDGDGDGTWSGGLGSFSDPSNPNSTYTPDASEFGSTVILNYAGCSPSSSCSADDASDEVEITINSSATASINQSSDGELCFGECTTIKFDFVGGEPPYDLDLTFTISGIGFPINFNAPGFEVNDGITICYDIGGIFPTYDSGSQTISVPEIAAGFSGTFTLNGFTDSNDCEGIVGGSGFSVSFLDTPEANFASLEACDEGGGVATFDLTEMDSDVNGGSGDAVNYYDDPALTNEVFSPYVSPSSVLYATVSNADCTSEPEEVDVIVIDNGDVGIVEFYCSDIGSTNCIICDEDGILGEVIEVLFVFNDPSVEHVVTINFIDDSGSTEDIYTLGANQTSLDFTISSNTTIEIISVITGEECADNTDLGEIVNITYLLSPALDDIGPFSECGGVVLPEITGNNLSGNEMYYTMSDQGGTSYSANDLITESINLYVYTGNSDCFDEIFVEIEILLETIFDEPNDTIVCGFLILPEIEGSGVELSAAYYTAPNGGGNIYVPGNIVLTNTTLYIFDPLSSCPSNEPSFQITILAEPILDIIEDIDTCGTYELPAITGALLTSNQAYYTEPNGMGIELQSGDTIFVSDTIYAYDNNMGCFDEIEIEIIIDEGPTAGIGDTISLCSATPQILNLPELLEQPADTLGLWSDDMGLLTNDTDSTQVNITGITGTINFMYVIENLECGNDTSHLQINIQEQFDAGGQDLITGCESEFGTIDLNTFWNIVGINDTIIVLGGETIDVTNPSVVDLSIVDPGIYNLLYIVGVMDTICLPDTANLTIQIDEALDAGEDISTSTCEGNIVQLENVLQGNNTIGVFGDPGATGALTGSSVDSEILGVGIFTFTHTVSSNGTCDGETIEIEIEVTNDVTAGVDVIDTICYTEEVNLYDYLDGASQGGIFYDPNNGNAIIPDGILVIDVWPTLPAGTPVLVTAAYKVGDDIDCPVSTSTLELLILPEPKINLEASQTILCDNILDILIDYTYLSNFGFTIEINGPLPELPISIPYVDFEPALPATEILALQINLDNYNLPAGIEYTISITSVIREDCFTNITEIPDTFVIGLQDTLLVNDIICVNESVTYDGQVYNASNPTGEIIIPRAGQCDSIILINLDIKDPATSLINTTLCTGQSITVGGTVYDETNPSGDFIFFGGSVNGCDSTVIIDLMFGDASVNDIVENICEGEILTFNSIVYDQNNLNGSDTLIGSSVGGCDSIINVNLTLLSTEIGTETTTTCDVTYGITVNGVLYDINSPTGSETIVGGSANGCDSTVIVDITFLDTALGLEDGSICPGESIIVNGSTYNQNQLIGTEIFAGQSSNGCDSIVNINLTLLDIPEGNFINSSCDENYELTINGNTYNIENPNGIELIANGASNGCDSLTNIQLNFEGITATSSIIQPDCNNSEGEVVITNISGVAPFFWEQSGGNFIEITEFPYTITGLSETGQLDFIDTDGCETIVTYLITEFNTPILSSEIIGNQIFVTGISIDEINSITWSSENGLSCNDCLNPTFVVLEDTDYNITINYGIGCEVTLSILVMAEETPVIPTYNIPNVFSPNGDGSNDIFYIIPGIAGSSQIVSMTIYDRWGNQIFRKENYTTEIGQGWDGTFKGQELNSGVFVYFIEVLENDVIKPFYGDVTIVK